MTEFESIKLCEAVRQEVAKLMLDNQEQLINRLVSCFQESGKEMTMDDAAFYGKLCTRFVDFSVNLSVSYVIASLVRTGAIALTDDVLRPDLSLVIGGADRSEQKEHHD